MLFYRNLLEDLKKWKLREDRKPLILRGARQVGKTTLIKEFAKTYDHHIFLNLEKAKDLQFLTDNDEVKEIVESLFLTYNISSKAKKNTLLFIDEIQESPRAIHMLRYFYEEAPDLHVIAAGSLLEFAMRKVKSFPVGRVEYLYLHPFNFSEYLKAIEHDQAWEQFQEIPIKPFAHKGILDLFSRYAIIGGMPEVLKVHKKTGSIADLPRIYESIWGTYKEDVEKYSVNDTDRKVIKHVMATAQFHVDERIKFQNFGNSNYRSREVGEALRSLDSARVIKLIYPTTEMRAPVQSDFKKSPRLQFLDTGLLNHTLGIQAQLLQLDDLSTAYKGAIIPHLITQELISLSTFTDNNPNFWVREKSQSSAEVDLVVVFEGKLIPIEIKSGKTGTLKSLHQFIDKSEHRYAVRIYGGEFNIEKTVTPAGTPYLLMNLPYYLGTKIIEYLEYFLRAGEE